MSIFDMLYDNNLAEAKEKLKNDLLDGMDKCSRVLVVTQRLGIDLDIFDLCTYTDILNRYANNHYKETKGMSAMELVAYLREGDSDDTKNI